MWVDCEGTERPGSCALVTFELIHSVEKASVGVEGEVGGIHDPLGRTVGPPRSCGGIHFVNVYSLTLTFEDLSGAEAYLLGVGTNVDK